MLPTSTATQQTWPPPGWLTKATASERLGLSESRVAHMPEIQTLSSRNPASNQPVKLFHEGDVERILFERQNPTQAAKVAAKPANLPVPVYPYPATAADVLAALKPAEPVKEKPWITVAEAAEYSGLPASTIEKLIARSVLPAMNCGPRPGGTFRVKRTDLDKLEGTR